MNWISVLKKFPFLEQLPNEKLELIKKSGNERTAKAGEIMLEYGQTCGTVPLVLQGNLRVYKIGESGREITMFRAYPGDTCLVNIACQFENSPLDVQVEAEEDSTLLIIPERIYKQVLENEIVWKDFIIQSLYKRMSETTSVLEQVTFSSIDVRLAKLLLQKRNGEDNMLYATHEQLASDLGTAREVVSRLVSELKQKQVIRTGRGKIEIINVNAMTKLAGM